jgi:hypothetical protein
VPVALYCWLAPGTIVVIGGETLIETSGSCTASDVEAVSDPDVAEIMVVPELALVVSPCVPGVLLTVATSADKEAHVTDVVMFAVDPHRTNGKGHAVLQGVQELSGGRGGGAGVGLNDIPARDDIAGGELFEDHAGHGAHVQSIDLHQVARPRHRVLLGFAHRVRARPQGTTRPRNSRARWFHQSALLLEMGENPAQHGHGDRDLLAALQNGQLVFAPARKLQTQSQNLFFYGKRPSRLA